MVPFHGDGTTESSFFFKSNFKLFAFMSTCILARKNDFNLVNSGPECILLLNLLLFLDLLSSRGCKVDAS